MGKTGRKESVELYHQKKEAPMSLEELEGRVKAIEDLEEIKKLQRRYMSHLDKLEFGEAVEMFSEDATAEVRNSGVKRGKKEIADIYLGILAQRKVRYDGHMVGQPIITVEGDTAKGTWIVYMLFSKPSVQWVQGRHDCEYVKEDGQWKFSKLSSRAPSPPSPPSIPRRGSPGRCRFLAICPRGV